LSAAFSLPINGLLMKRVFRWFFPVSQSPIIKDSLKMMQKRVVSVENVEYPIENSFISFNLHSSWRDSTWKIK